MSPMSEKITDMIDMLPEREQDLVYELVKRLVLAWDSDFTKVTPDEAQAIAEAEEDYARGETVRLDSLTL